MAVFGAGLVTQTTCARVIFAMSRDGNFPAHQVMKRVNPRTQTPIPATLLTVVIGVIYGVLHLPLIPRECNQVAENRSENRHTVTNAKWCEASVANSWAMWTLSGSVAGPGPRPRPAYARAP